MPALVAALWADDKGAVVSAELVLVVTLLVLGIIPGLVALRNCENASLATVGNSFLAIQTGFSFAPWSVGIPTNKNSHPFSSIAQVNGGFYSVTGATFLVSSHVGSNNVVTSVAVSPAP